MKDYVVWHPDYAGWRTLFETRREACDFCDAEERKWAERGSPLRVPLRITYYGREVDRDDVEYAAGIARDSARSTVALAKKTGRLRTFRGGLVAVR